MRRDGSVTVFAVLLLTALFSTFFALLEGARVYGLQVNAKMCAMQAADGLLSGYNRALWEDYRLLFWEGKEGDFPDLSLAESQQRAIVEGNWKQSQRAGSNYDLLPVHISRVEVKSYRLATDGGGYPLRRQAASQAGRNVAKTALQALLDMMENGMPGEGEAATVRREQEAVAAMEQMRKTQGAVEEKGQPANPGDPGKTALQTAQGQTLDNPIEKMEQIKKAGIFTGLTLPGELSQKKVELGESVGRRRLQTGTIAEEEEEKASDKLLFRLYLDTTFADVTEEPANRVLDYEMEYLAAGKDSDRGNLTAVIHRLILIREASNLLYLETNAAKREEALAVAAAISTAFGQPEAASTMQRAVLVAWAYLEAVHDVQILLDGGRVSLIKNDAQWHTQLGALTPGPGDGEKQDEGLCYSDYLQILLWTVTDRKLTQRAMDLMEWNTGVHMDRMVCCMNCAYEFEAKPLFWNFVRIGGGTFRSYRFSERKFLSYLP